MFIEPSHLLLNYQEPVSDFQLRNMLRNLHQAGIKLLDRGEGRYSLDCFSDGHYHILFCRSGVELESVMMRLREAVEFPTKSGHRVKG